MGKAGATAITVCASGRKSLETDYTGHILYITHVLKYAFVNYIVTLQSFYICENALHD